MIPEVLASSSHKKQMKEGNLINLPNSQLHQHRVLHLPNVPLDFPKCSILAYVVSVLSLAPAPSSSDVRLKTTGTICHCLCGTANILLLCCDISGVIQVLLISPSSYYGEKNACGILTH